MAENIIIYTTLESQYHGLDPTTAQRGVNKNNPSRKHNFLHAFKHIADIVTKH